MDRELFLDALHSISKPKPDEARIIADFVAQVERERDKAKAERDQISEHWQLTLEEKSWLAEQLAALPCARNLGNGCTRNMLRDENKDLCHSHYLNMATKAVAAAREAAKKEESNEPTD